MIFRVLLVWLFWFIVTFLLAGVICFIFTSFTWDEARNCSEYIGKIVATVCSIAYFLNDEI